ncbi:hypothetical protein A3F29_02600 [Candidatus Roizmanbacteria bacterium RIFCSPHIGHO2_12_FULL_33_9]|uniref:peptidylprolyl isomerase n=1 Tax=Candidatus Roizmanbacteria bacterium RIFCSPHIGHO2_12_FULL_33_9 TaxID=1802045 RepID=A0A1F7HK38_9BACT|nr:MAG: hypothetical protein A3F29_02600 [Candidatus Roizmanbacteria bacterium RIFCSPHIGHO2_12_FULL_33_9]
MLFESGKPKNKKLQSFIDKELKYLLGLILILGLLNTYKGNFISATVNGKIISRYSLIKELERQGKDLAVDSLISQELILQEAKRKKINITQKEFDKTIDNVKKSLEGSQQTLDGFLVSQNLTHKDFLKQVKMQLIIEKLVSSGIKISDEQINKYLEENSEFFPVDLSEKELRDAAISQLKQVELNAKIQELLTNLRNKANIKFFNRD